MANVLNRTTKQYLASANTPDYPVIDWIINPDLSATTGFNSKYWTITGDVITLMSQAERDAVDAAELAAQIASDKSDASAGTDTDRRLLGFMQVMVDEINILRQATGTPPARSLQDYKTATKNNIGNQ